MGRRLVVFLGCLALVAVAAVIAGEAVSEDQSLKLAVDLQDDSHIIGVPSIASINIVTPFAEMNIPLKKVQGISFGAKDGKAVITLQNGDVLTASIKMRSLDLKTLFGEMEVPLSVIKEFAVMSGEAGTGLLLYYTFDKDSDGKVIDQSGRRFNGNISGNVLYEQSFKGKAARFTAPNSYIMCDAKELNMDGWRQATVSAWVFFRKFTTYGCVLSRGEVTGEQTGGISLFAGGRYGGSWYHNIFRINSRGKAEDVNGTRFQGTYPKLGRWYHMAGTYDGKNLCLYVDGELDVSREVPETSMVITDNPANKLVIGTDGMRSRIESWTDVYLDGMVDEVRVYSRCLGKEEIRRLYKECAPLAEKLAGSIQ